MTVSHFSNINANLCSHFHFFCYRESDHKLVTGTSQFITEQKLLSLRIAFTKSWHFNLKVLFDTDTLLILRVKFNNTSTLPLGQINKQLFNSRK